jgi:GNAT superfamily N-acetyltransferase
MEGKMTFMQINIQVAEARHLEEIVSIIRQTSKWLKAKGINQWNENFPITRLEAEVSNGELFVVLDKSKKVIGTLSLSNSEGELWPNDGLSAIYLNRLAISREYAGLNLGVRIIDWVKEYSKRKGLNRLRLNCDKTNPFLPHFYHGCGFHCIGESFYPPWNMTFTLFETNV